MPLFMNLVIHKFLCRGIQGLLICLLLHVFGLPLEPIQYMFTYIFVAYVMDKIVGNPVLTYDIIPKMNPPARNNQEEEEEEKNG